jgi:type IV pilus assembly protein PilQ
VIKNIFTFFMVCLSLLIFSGTLIRAEDPQTIAAIEDVTDDTANDTANPLDVPLSFSDMALEELTGATANDVRDLFAPGVIENEFDPTSLTVEGVIIGPNTKLALVAGQMLSIDDRVGNYTVNDIRPGKIVLKQLEEEYVVKMDGYSPQLQTRDNGKFYVEFQNADLKKSLRMLAKSGAINIMIPEDTKGTLTVAFNNIDILDVLASILRVNELEYAFENRIMRIGKATQFKDDSDLMALTMPLRYATSKELEEKVKAFLSDRGSTTSDERTNTIIVKDHANVINNVRNFLVEIDKKDPQVSIEAKIIDASKSFARSLGIQWGLTSGPNNMILRGNQDSGAITNGNQSGTAVNLPADTPTSGIDILVGRLPFNTTLQTQLSAAEENGTIRIISKPNVTTINNKAAKIRSGVKIYVKVDGGTDQGPELKEIDTGIELKVTPQITINRMIKMNIEATQSEADFSRTVDNIPAILDNTASTTVLIPDGETAVIGGLLRVSTTSEKKSVPGISKIPIVGWLFKSSNRTKDNKELMIFITPKILDAEYFEMKKGSQQISVKTE